MNVQKLIWGLEELADQELQKKLWAGKSDGEVSSFTEAICVTFDDSGLGNMIDSNKNSEITPEEFIIKAKRLDAIQKRIPDSLTPDDVIKHPLMNEVRALAADLLSILRK